jgi:hypothetical protein
VHAVIGTPANKIGGLVSAERGLDASDDTTSDDVGSDAFVVDLELSPVERSSPVVPHAAATTTDPATKRRHAIVRIIALSAITTPIVDTAHRGDNSRLRHHRTAPPVPNVPTTLSHTLKRRLSRLPLPTSNPYRPGASDPQLERSSAHSCERDLLP